MIVIRDCRKDVLGERQFNRYHDILHEDISDQCCLYTCRDLLEIPELTVVWDAMETTVLMVIQEELEVLDSLGIL